MRPVAGRFTHLLALRSRTLYVVKYVCVCQPWSYGMLCFLVKSAHILDSVGASGSCHTRMPRPQWMTPLRTRSGLVTPVSARTPGCRKVFGCDPKAIS